MKAESQLLRTIEIKDRTGRVVGSKEVVTYQGLLQKAHEEGLARVKTELLQIPTQDNAQVAIAKAEVETSRGVFEGLGDASPENVNSFIIPHLIRMAETRAKARALRDAVNVGVVSFEELEGDGFPTEAFEPGAGTPTPTTRNSRSTRSRPSTTSGRIVLGVVPGAGNGNDTMTEAQRRYLFRILAGQGIQGEAAHEYLKDQLGVDELAQVTKTDATALIDRLLTGPPEGSPARGAPQH